MIKDNLHTGEEVRAKLISGIRKCSEAVGGTMGTGGANSLIEMVENPHHIVTNDGATILSSIKLADPIEEMGRNILMESVGRSNKVSGDGSSTTTVLTHAILEEGTKHLKNASPMEIKRSLEACIPLIEQSINEQKREITVDEVGKVASISAEDEGIGGMIQEIYQKIGKDGIIHWDISKTAEDTYTIGNGLTVNGAGIASPYMCDRDKTTGNFATFAKMKNPLVIVTREKITTGAVFESLFVSLNSKGKKEVVIFCEDFDVTAISHFVMTQQVQGFRVIVIKLPVLWGDEWREDLALASGATLIDPNVGLSLKDIKEEHLGTFKHLTTDKDATYIDGIKDLSAHIESLKAEDTDQSNLRASRLNTKTARYFVGAQSDSALSYRRLKVEDAIASAYHALQGGIVVGGGWALAIASEGIGNEILKEALKAPINQITKNMGKKYTAKMMEEQQVFDPAVIVMNAVKNAISVSATVLTVNTIVTFPREEQTLNVPQ